MNEIKQNLIKRGLKRDGLLDALDIVSDILKVNGTITKDGFAILYHCTDEKSAKNIVLEQYMYSEEDGIFMSTHWNNQIKGYGNKVISLQIPIEKLILDDDFGTELHYKIKTGFKKGISVKAIML